MFGEYRGASTNCIQHLQPQLACFVHRTQIFRAVPSAVVMGGCASVAFRTHPEHISCSAQHGQPAKGLSSRKPRGDFAQQRPCCCFEICKNPRFSCEARPTLNEPLRAKSIFKHAQGPERELLIRNITPTRVVQFEC